MQFPGRLVVQAFIAQVQYEVCTCRVGPQFIDYSVMIIDIRKAVVANLSERSLELPDRVVVVGVEHAAGFDLVGLAMVAHQNGHAAHGWPYRPCTRLGLL